MNRVAEGTPNERTKMDVDAYLKRIGFVGGRAAVKVDLETLTKLQNLHQESVPFENLDAMQGKVTNLTA